VVLFFCLFRLLVKDRVIIIEKRLSDILDGDFPYVSH